MKKHFRFLIVGAIAFFAMIPSAFAGTLNLVTDKTQFAIGDEFSVDVKINSENIGINAAQATINFPVNVLQEKSTDKANSVFSFWLQDPIADNTAGKVSFIGGSDTLSGVDGKTLQILRVTFKVVGSGPANIAFTDGAITASDGNGTNVLTTMTGLNITSITKQQASLIIPAPKIPAVQIISRPAVPTGKLPVKPVIEVPLYPTSQGWYNTISSFIVRWQLPTDVTDVATAINQNPVSDVKTSEGLFNNKTFDHLTDGVWYLHVRFKNDVGWGTVADYQIGIDTVPPLSFNVIPKEGLTTGVLSPTISFQTNDQPSGVASYLVSIDGKDATTTNLTSYTLSPLSSGKHLVTVSAADMAGNKTSTSINMTILENVYVAIGSFTLTQSQFFVIIICILVLIFGLWWYSYMMWNKQLERRILIAERDIGDTFDIMGNDADKILALTKEGKIGAKDLNEVIFTAKKIKEKAGKTKKYIVDNIRDIARK